MKKIICILGYSTTAIPALRGAMDATLRELRLDVDFRVVSLNRLSYVLEDMRSSDLCFIYAPAKDHLEEAVAKCCGKILAISEDFMPFNNVDPEYVQKASIYFKRGGSKNLRSLCRLFFKILGFGVEVPDPEEVPWEGVYHPSAEREFPSTKEYLNWYEMGNRPLVGILFYRSDWLYGNLSIVNALVRELESEGLGVLPVFSYGFADKFLGTASTDEIIERFFMRGETSFIHLLINLQSFYLLKKDRRVRDPRSHRVASGIELLKKLNVPIIGPLASYYKSVEKWIHDSSGVDYMTQVYRVIMREVDGVIEPIFVAGTSVDEYGAKRYQCVPDQVKYLAKRVKRWINLRLKEPSERKIAIVLHNPPCKGLEASVAVGLGLDVPESVVRILHRLRKLGYNVGDRIPETGKELIDEIMSKKAVSEFRWTSIDEIVRKGGAYAFVDSKTYLKWFNELPERARRRIVDAWGDPLEVLSKKPEGLAGMVYEGKFVIPGVAYGNVFITPQPKRGCAGSRCDGRYCRILHDPNLPVPHQWIAVYKWLEENFDLVIHVGTHGYMEFTPGKGVGLSPECFPEISIGTVPHLYIYVVSNPMEGVIAKRRGYATLVDHLIAPMAKVDAYGALEEIKNILLQYKKAKQLGDLSRAEEIYRYLLEKCREANIELPDEKSKEDIVEEIHRHLDLVEESLVEQGLHVFGTPPSNEKVARMAVSLMKFDHSGKSIRRVLCELLSLNYEEITKDKLRVVEGYGITGRELLDRLDDVAVNVLRKLLSRYDLPDQLDLDYLLSILQEELASTGLQPSIRVRRCENE